MKPISNSNTIWVIRFISMYNPILCNTKFAKNPRYQVMFESSSETSSWHEDLYMNVMHNTKPVQKYRKYQLYKAALSVKCLKVTLSKWSLLVLAKIIFLPILWTGAKEPQRTREYNKIHITWGLSTVKM